MASLLIPTPLRRFTAGQSRLEIQAGTIGEAVSLLTTEFPDLKKQLLDEKGDIRSFINIFVGEDDIRDLQQSQTALTEKSEVSIIPAIAGGIQ